MILLKKLLSNLIDPQVGFKGGFIGIGILG